MRRRRILLPASLFSLRIGPELVANDRLSGRDDDSVRRGVEDLDEGDEEGVEAGEKAKVSADSADVQTPEEIAEVSRGKEEEGEP